jgi:asparagine synthase (glutamine-hydrolysing)
MLDAAPYRGPDGTRIHAVGNVGLGHASMAVTPEDELERQPVVSTRTGCVIVADLRLDNREELSARLRETLTPRTGDAQLLLRAYDAWGLDAPKHLLGDFAFAIWDPRDRTLVCGRDTSGQRSLFYRSSGSEFAAASEIQQLLQDPAIRVEPNEGRVRDFLTPLNMLRNEKDSYETYYEGIFSVLAGQLVVVSGNGLTARRYWTFEPPTELRYRTNAEYAEHYRALLSDVVRPRLRSSRPIGVMLSGGLDSSSVACTALELLRSGTVPGRLKSFSFVFDGLDCDERDFIRDIEEMYGLEAHYVSPGTFGGRLRLEPSGFLEAPSLGIAEARDALFGVAQRAGVRALLTGDIADSCVNTSWRVFDALLRGGALTAFRRHLQLYRQVSSDSLRRILAIECAAPLLPLPLERRVMLAYTGRRWGSELRRLLPSWIPDALRHDLARRQLALMRESEAARRFSSHAREDDFRHLYPPEMARHPVPWALEFSRPFADRRIHAFFLAIPPERKLALEMDDSLYPGRKELVRQAMVGILPESIRQRRDKTIFSAVYQSEVERQWPLYEAAFAPSARSEISRRGYVDADAFWQRLQRLRDGDASNDSVYVMELVGIETWLRALRLPRPELVRVALPTALSADALDHEHREPDRVVA